MRTTDLNFRSPKHANVSYHGKLDITEGQKNKTYRFLRDHRFQYGSIYQNPSQHAPLVGPTSYKNEKKK